MSIEESCLAVMCLLLLWRETCIFYSSCSFYFHIFMGLHLLRWWHHPLAALNHTKIQFLNWPGTIWSYALFPREEQTDFLLYCCSLSWGGILRYPQLPWEQSPPYIWTPQMAVDGAMSLDSGPWGFRLVPVGVHGMISPGVLGFGCNSPKNCCTGLNCKHLL